MNKVQHNFNQKDNDFVRVEGNKFFIDNQTNYNEFADESNSALKNHCDLDKLIADQGEFRKFVFGCQANNEMLPFPDESFNAYLANLSVHIVDNPQN